MNGSLFPFLRQTLVIKKLEIECLENIYNIGMENEANCADTIPESRTDTPLVKQAYYHLA